MGYIKEKEKEKRLKECKYKGVFYGPKTERGGGGGQQASKIRVLKARRREPVFPTGGRRK